MPDGRSHPAETWSLLLSNGALTPMAGEPPCGEAPHASLRLARSTLDAVLGRTTTFADEIVAGRVLVAGEVQALVEFASFLTQPDPDFAIVTP
ncbi:alkyl sulfatase C-terminal domain-containing protein [Kitasatospora sp. LaBMicrA B282]|uniref:alkyl sulfatase C-terminal domain-containing protein n=1 Tax=Kitasatospora sp. LaBMicrA B282 TaxID=3420949 RepID=UPI003D0FF96F